MKYKAIIINEQGDEITYDADNAGLIGDVPEDGFWMNVKNCSPFEFDSMEEALDKIRAVIMEGETYRIEVIE